MVSKSEYQPWYGSEYITPREINEQWMDAYLRPESKIFCGTQFMIKSELVDRFNDLMTTSINNYESDTIFFIVNSYQDTLEMK